MKILLRKAKIIQEGHPLNGKVRDILIENGIIKDLNFKGKTDANTSIISSKNLHVSNGWVDLKANLGQPGFEERETLISGSKAAAAGGFTKVCVLPSNNPISENKSTVEFIKNHNKDNVVTLLPYGSITTGCNGKDLADLYDMKQAGAIGFTDDLQHIQNPKLLQLALEYAKGFDGIVVSVPLNHDIAGKGNVNEGHASTSLGLKGIPHFAEEIQVARDLKILEYTEGRLHFTGISSAESFQLIANAKKKGLDVTCDVAAHLLVFNDDVLEDFDSNFKVMPPIRTEKDRKSIIKNLQANVIDAVVSDHRPQNIENKDCEFETAHYGMIGLQTVFSNLLEAGISIDMAVNKLTSGPSNVINLKQSEIDTGNMANLTIFDPDLEWDFTSQTNYSLSSNSPFLDKTLKGKVLGVIQNNAMHINS